MKLVYLNIKMTLLTSVEDDFDVEANHELMAQEAITIDDAVELYDMSTEYDIVPDWGIPRTGRTCGQCGNPITQHKKECPKYEHNTD